MLDLLFSFMVFELTTVVKKLGTLEKVACWTKIEVPLLCMQVVCAWREIQIVNKLCTASGLECLSVTMWASSGLSEGGELKN